MARQPPLKFLSTEDYKKLDPEVAAAFQKLVQNLNPFLTATSDALGRKLTVSDNLACVVREVEVTQPEDWITVENFGSGWSSYDPTGTTYAPVGYRKAADGRVHLRGLATGGQPKDAVFTLPAEILPQYQEEQDALVDINLSGVVPGVHPGGVVILQDGRVFVRSVVVWNGAADTSQEPSTTAVEWVSFDGISFDALDRRPAEAPTPYPLLVSVRELAGRPAHVQVVGCEDISTRSPTPFPYPRPSWSPTDTSTGTAVRINSLVGLVPGRKYRVTLLITT
jgi:hypothetical protein